jgi:hypothetical protein
MQKFTIKQWNYSTKIKLISLNLNRLKRFSNKTLVNKLRKENLLWQFLRYSLLVIQMNLKNQKKLMHPF